MNLTNAENLKLATARKPTLNPSILVAYPRLNHGEWVTPLVYSQHKLDSSVEGGAQIHCYWIFGGGLLSQILAFKHRKSNICKG